jgi:hypothetical protein
MPYLVTTRKPGGTPITKLPPVSSRPAALAKLVESHGPLVLTHRLPGKPFVYQFEDGTAATIVEKTDEHPSPIPA